MGELAGDVVMREHPAEHDRVRDPRGAGERADAIALRPVADDCQGRPGDLAPDALQGADGEVGALALVEPADEHQAQSVG